MHPRILLAAAMMACACGAPAPPRPTPAPPPPAATPPSAAAPEREDFEAATTGSLPPGWTIDGTPKEISFSAEPGNGGTLLQIAITNRGSGKIKRRLDVTRYRGKRVMVVAHGSCERTIPLAQAAVGLDVTHPGPRGYGDRGDTAPIDDPVWKEVRAIVDVAPDANALDLVISAGYASTIRVDDISVSVLGTAGVGDEPHRALEGRALDNVVAFARLYGVVRYFHPSDEAAVLDAQAWEQFVVRGIRAVESAPDAAALRSRLEQQFAPIAPAVAIRVDGERAPTRSAVEGPMLHWVHLGLGMWQPNVYWSSRETGEAFAAATITTAVDPTLVRGKELKVTLRAKGKLAGDRAEAGLVLDERRASHSDGFTTEPKHQPAIGADWTEISVPAKLSADAEGLTIGVEVTRDADVWFEPPVITADGKPISLAPWGVPGGRLSSAWDDAGADYVADVGNSGCEAGHTCLHVYPKAKPRPDRRPWTSPLGGGVTAYVPLELPTQGGKTLPAAVAPLSPRDLNPLLAGDRATRLAAVVIAWNVFQHFYPYFDVRGTDWMPELPLRLREAALDDGAAAFHKTLRKLVHDLHDGHGSVSIPGEDTSRTTPWRWEWVEGKLAITQVSESCACDLKPGDVVTAIDGTPVEQAVTRAAELISSATDQFRAFQLLRRLSIGPENGRRRVTVERDGAAHDVDVAPITPAQAPAEKRPTSGDEVAPGIRYLNIDAATPEQWLGVLSVAAATKGLIVDARGYPGPVRMRQLLEHFTNKPIHCARWNVPAPARPDREGLTFAESEWTVHPAKPFVGNLVFLTDGRAVSAAETFMGIVEHYKLGEIVGSATAGTNGNVNPFTVPGGYVVRWTGLQTLKQDGSRHHGVGVLPTVPAARTLAGVAAQRDEVLEKGIEVALRKARQGRQRK